MDLTTAFKSIKTNAIGGCNEIGRNSVEIFSKSKLNKSILGKFNKSLDKDVFLSNYSKENFTKTTALGAGIVGATVGLATLCILGIKNKIVEVKNKDNN